MPAVRVFGSGNKSVPGLFTEIFAVTCVDVKNLADVCTKSFENAIEKEQFNWHGDFVFQSEEEVKEKKQEFLLSLAGRKFLKSLEI